MTGHFVVFNADTFEAYGEGSADHCSSVRRQLPKLQGQRAITRSKSFYDSKLSIRSRNRLHEAAPDLLSALKECAWQIAQIHNRKLTADEQVALDAARDAIAKAEGKP